jgi:DNA-binding NarL/FixJ family response regulator
MGAVLKSVEFVDLANAIRKIAAGEKVIDQEIRRFLRAEPAIEPLSPRQREILDAIVNGLSNADISARFGISLDMVKEHNQKLFEKLGVSNRAEAIAITLRKHLLKI